MICAHMQFVQCLHPDCPDFDLCEACEALPIPVHPVKHTLAKIRAKDAYIPTISVPTTETEPLRERVADSTIACQTEEIELVPDTASGVTAELTTTVDPTAEPTGNVPDNLHEAQGYAPVYEYPPSSDMMCFYVPPSSQISRVSSVLDYADPIPSIPPLIPASWTSPELDWRWRSPSPGLMVIPQASSEQINVSSTLSPQAQELVASDTVESMPPAPPAELRPAYIYDRQISPVSSPKVDMHIATALAAEEPIAIPGALSSSASTSGPTAHEVDWQQIWPEVTTVLKHLLNPPSPAPERTATMPGALEEGSEDSKQETEVVPDQQTVNESPLAAEALLSRPTSLEGPEMVERPRVAMRLSDYLVSTSPSNSPVLPHSLQVACVQSNNIPDGQQFPPGAEFVKSWRMRNDGQVPWPEETALVFVAGERLATHEGAVNRMPIGSVQPGEETEMSCAEMKVCSLPSDATDCIDDCV